MHHTSSATAFAAASALSEHVEPLMAAEQVCEAVKPAFEAAAPDLVLVFVSGRHAEQTEELAGFVRRSLGPAALLGLTAEGVLAGEREVEQRAAVAVFAASLPGTTLRTFAYKQIPHAMPDDPAALAQLAEAVGIGPDARGVFFLADPFTVPASPAVAAFSALPRVVTGLRRLPVIGGLASASSSPGRNVLVCDDAAMRSGGVGLVVSGDVAVDTLVSQGCRPIGRPMLITGASRNLIKTLGGRRALSVLRETLAALSPEDKDLVNTKGVYIGRVINEYKPRFGRGDFLIRGIAGIDEETGVVSVGDHVAAGQTVQFHLRDARTASEDLSLLLSAQQLQSRPVGGLLFTCNGRGSRLFDEPDHDARMVSGAFTAPGVPPLPLAGFFAAGEIGPIGDRSFLHGHTAALALIRPRTRSDRVE
ncbi:MAG: FIST C-terminal domain-containing protein [Phycisphaerales bacterium]|nr:FIST C-terminal domain-containing protein [Phycisphaerales bacterium]